MEEEAKKIKRCSKRKRGKCYECLQDNPLPPNCELDNDGGRKNNSHVIIRFAGRGYRQGGE